MGIDTKIQWCHHTFNPWWGCARVSPGCEHCYAETFANRFDVKWGVQEVRRFFGDKHWAEPFKWDRAAALAGERHRVFCASMADVFEDRPDLVEHRERLWHVISRTPHLDWLLLTKRPENMVAMAPSDWANTWPSNVWAGTTVEDQRRADERVPHLLQVPADIRFLSCEPLLGPVDLGTPLFSALRSWDDAPIQWVIIGGESGRLARPFALDWARTLMAQCLHAGVPAFVKQLGAAPIWNGCSDPSGHWPAGTRREDIGGKWRIHLADRKGGDMTEWPSDLRVRQFPRTVSP